MACNKDSLSSSPGNIINLLKDKLKNHEPGYLNLSSQYSVLLPLILNREDKLSLLFEVRAENLSTQPGEISLPGGKIEPGETPGLASLRETSEELGLSSNRIEYLGPLHRLVTPYNIIIHSHLGSLLPLSLREIRSSINPAEIQEIFTVPLDFFLRNEPEKYNLSVKPEPISNKKFPFHLIKNGREYDWRSGQYPVYFYRYRNRIIWGFTARLVLSFTKLFNSLKD